MEPITLSIVTTYVAKRFLDQFIKNQGYNRLEKLFFPKKKYANRLRQLILQVQEEYQAKYPIPSDSKKFPFYQSKVLYEHLNNHIVFKSEELDLLMKQFEKEPNVIRPSKQQLNDYYDLFINKVNSDNQLKKLYIEESYTTEIFNISKRISSIEEKIDSLKGDQKEVIGMVSKMFKEIRPYDSVNVISHFVVRNEEADLIAIIESENVLLLSGISFCGKSQMAKKLSNNLIEKGYKFLNRSDIGEAERFLRNDDEPRLFLLEDPFGHNSESESSVNWKKIEELIQNLPKNNKLIITSRTEVLRSVRKVTNLENCNVGKHHWVDLTTDDRDFLLETWEILSEAEKVDKEIKDKIREYLRTTTDKKILQVGQLNHLAKTPIDRLRGQDIEGLLHIARADSRDISVEIQNRGTDAFRLFVCLGITATTNIPVKIADIEYVLNNNEHLASYLEVPEKIRIWSSKDGENQIKLEDIRYECPKLNDQLITELGFIEQRGFIQIIDQAIRFTHPTYEEAAKYCLIGQNIEQITHIKRLLKKSLSTLSTDASVVASKRLKFIFNNSSESELKKVVTNIGYEAYSRSIFPGVKDNCFSFLLSELKNLETDHKTEILYRLEAKFSDTDIAWNGETPYIQLDRLGISLDYVPLSHKDATALNEKINNGLEVSKSDIWKLLLFLSNDLKSPLPSTKGILKILSYDEAFIRQRASYILLFRGCPKDKTILDAIFSDDHPSVIFEAIKGCISAIFNYTLEEIQIIKQYIELALANPFVVIRGNNLFTTFGIDYGSESLNWRGIEEEAKSVIWSLWADLIIIFLQNYPKNLRISNSGRFGSTLDSSIKFITPQQSLKICESLYNWLDQYMKSDLPDTYEFGVLPHLLSSTKGLERERLELFKKIMSHKDTNFITYSISWCIRYWKELSEEEISFLIGLLRDKSRVDHRWLKAVFITQNFVPGEIQYELFGVDNHFEIETKELVESLDNQLLEDCLHVYCGYPQPLWWLGYHHSQSEKWREIIRWILVNQYDIGFDTCLREIINDGVNGYQPQWKFKEERIWEILCETTCDKKKLTERLAYWTARCTCNVPSASSMWHQLIKVYGDNNEELVDIIVDYIEPLQYNHPEDLLTYFDNGFYEKYILPRFKVDEMIINLLIRIDDGIIDTGIDMIVQGIVAMIQKESVKLDITFKYIEKIAKNNEDKFPALSALNEIPYMINANYSEWQKKKSDDYRLDNWISIDMEKE